MERKDHQLTKQNPEGTKLIDYSKKSEIRLSKGSLAEIKKNGCSVSKLRKENPELLENEIIKLIEMVFMLVNVKRSLSAEAILMTAEMIIDEYWYMKIEEIRHAFKNGIKGKYKDVKVLDRVDANILIGWCRAYSSSDELISVAEKKGAAYRAEENKPQNTSLLEVPEFREKIMKKISGRPLPKTYTEEEKKAHSEMIRKQSEEILKRKQ